MEVPSFDYTEQEVPAGRGVKVWKGKGLVAGNALTAYIICFETVHRGTSEGKQGAWDVRLGIDGFEHNDTLELYAGGLNAYIEGGVMCTHHCLESFEECEQTIKDLIAEAFQNGFEEGVSV